MSTPRRIAAVMASTLLAVPLWGTPAYADTASEPPSSAAYFNQAGVSKPDPAPMAPPNLTANVDGVAPGNLAVAAQAGREDKVSFLFFALSAVPAGATISKATLTMTTVPNSPQNVTLNAAPDKVVVCKIVGSGFSTEDGENLALAPQRDCPSFKAAGTGDASQYVFDVTGLAATWAELNDGLALTKDPARNDPFQVVFTRDAVLDVEFTGGETLTTDVLPTAPTSGSFDTGSTTTTSDTGSADLSFGSGTTDVGGGSTDLGGGFATAAPLTAAPTAPSVPTPETAAAAPVTATPLSSGGPVEMLSPTVGFWVGALALAAVLALLSLILGDNRAPVAATAKPSRLTQALSARQRAGGSSALVARPS